MPTMPERMATVETKVETIDRRTEDTDKKVDLLVGWMNEERGAKLQRDRDARRNRTVVGAAATLLGALGSAAYNLIFGGS